MFKVHKKVKYALLALKYIKDKPDKELTTAKEISAQLDIPFDPTSRVLQIMGQNGILEAEQGAYGGYRLVGDINKLAIFELSQMISGGLALTNCCSEDAECDRMDDCIIKDSMSRLNLKLVAVLKSVKVGEMI